MQQQPVYKIYSRKRIAFNRNKKYGRKIKIVLPIIVILIIGLIICFIVTSAINPVFETLCEEEARSIATIVTNEETTKVMEKYSYGDFFTIEKDNNGNVKMISANILKINQITSDIAIYIQKSLEKNEKNKIHIAIGNITGIKVFSGFGPRIALKVYSTGNVETDLRSEFISQGVNQTLHKVYLDIGTTVNILTPFSTIEKTINNQVLILENVIVGEIPSTYYNFNGLNNNSDMLEIIE